MLYSQQKSPNAQLLINNKHNIKMPQRFKNPTLGERETWER